MNSKAYKLKKRVPLWGQDIGLVLGQYHAILPTRLVNNREEKNS